ncbi:hypothetical protein PHLCEN_2v1991 [Hermanssonia centrifuga]|uniref:Uncharacterized protein n=1 Tax=Hermanssonia centrifuga TaxID=98765 RepID=A0A2R6RQD2_9APHY|nr:hypothetical protein PHLCEN_2v1991 [Hermanssonia centrifuga]
MRLVVQNLCLSHLAPRELRAVKVHFPVIETQGCLSVPDRAGTTSRLGSEAEEWSKDEISCGEVEEGKEA